jgi:hypothetical protein
MNCYVFELPPQVSSVRNHDYAAQTEVKGLRQQAPLPEEASVLKTKTAPFENMIKLVQEARTPAEKQSILARYSELITGPHTIDHKDDSSKQTSTSNTLRDKQDPFARHHNTNKGARALRKGKGQASLRRKAGGRRILLESAVFTISWDKNTETLKIKANKDIPAETYVWLQFGQADFPIM